MESDASELSTDVQDTCHVQICNIHIMYQTNSIQNDKEHCMEQN